MLIVEIALRGALVAAATLAFHAAIRHRSPAVRHTVLLVGLGILALLPVEVAVGPRWRPAIGFAPPNPPSSDLLRAMAAIPEPQVGAGPTTAAVSSPVLTPVVATRLGAEPLVVVVALLGSLVCLVARVGGGWSVRRLVARGRSLESDHRITRASREAAAELGLERAHRIIESKECTVPFTAGILTPAVVVPPDFTAWPHPTIRAILLHELAHVRRHDVLTRLVADVACALNWFNPLVWLCARRCASEAEFACDDAVVQARVDPRTYAKQLVRLARAFRGRRILEPTVSFARGALVSRVERLISPPMTLTTVTRSRPVLATAALAALGLLSAAATPRFAAPQFVVSGPTTLNISSGGPEISSNAAGLQARWVVDGRHTGMFITGVVDLDDVLAGLTASDAGSFVIAQESDDRLLTYEWPNAAPPPAWVRESLRLASGQLRRLQPLEGRETPTPSSAPEPPRFPGSTLFGTPARSDDPTARVIQAGWIDNQRRVGVFMRGRWSAMRGRPVSDDRVAWLDAFVWDAGRLTRITISRSARGDLETRMVRDNRPALVDDAALAWAARLVDHVNAAGIP